MDYLDYSRIEVDMLEIEIDTWEEWCLPGFLVCAKNAQRSMVPSWLLKVSHGTRLCEKCAFFLQDWIDAHPIGSRLNRIMWIMWIIRLMACIAIIAIIEIDNLQ